MDRKIKRFFVSAALALAGLGGACGSVSAQETIGRAAAVRNDVSQLAPTLTRINIGDSIFRDEVVRTNVDSDAKFVFRDDTNLSLGPGSTLKLDKAVFSDESRYREVAVKLTSGAFRFVTGHSDKEAYTIRTPLASIGVRGTILEFLIERTRNIVVLQEGQASVCTNKTCVQLLNPGDTAVVTPTGAGGTRINRVNTPPWTFAAACSANPSLCSETQFAEGAPPPPAPGPDFAAALCGR